MMGGSFLEGDTRVGGQSSISPSPLPTDSALIIAKLTRGAIGAEIWTQVSALGVWTRRRPLGWQTWQSSTLTDRLSSSSVKKPYKIQDAVEIAWETRLAMHCHLNGKEMSRNVKKTLVLRQVRNVHSEWNQRLTVVTCATDAATWRIQSNSLKYYCKRVTVILCLPDKLL